MAIPSSSDRVYDVYTTANPAEISDIALEIYRMWLVFATGGTELNGKIIRNPGGDYARSIRMEDRGINHVAIIADSSIAPEAHWLEVGHAAYDMKQDLTPGKAYPMHYGGGEAARGVFGPSNAKGQFITGFARFNANSSGWIIPAMKAYEPGLALAKMAAKMAGGGEVSWNG